MWGRHEDVAAIEIRPRLAVAPDLVLRQLDPTPLAGNEARITEALRPLYEAMTAGAAALALGEPAPSSRKKRSQPASNQTPWLCPSRHGTRVVEQLPGLPCSNHDR